MNNYQEQQDEVWNLLTTKIPDGAMNNPWVKNAFLFGFNHGAEFILEKWQESK